MFEFTDEDLKLNQRGQLSPSQKEWLKNVARGARSLSRMNAWIAVSFIVFGLCLIGALYLQNESTRAALFSNPLNLLIFPVMVVMILGILALSIVLAYWNARKLENATLLSATGNVRLDESYSSKSNLRSYHVFVGKKRFTFGDDVSRKFREGEKYRVYYCKPGMYEFVMSYEKMDDSKINS